MPTLNWLGREKTTDDLRQVALRILREDRELSHSGGARLSRPNDAEVRTGGMPHAENAESAEGILVHGDNLEALKALLPFYAGRVRCIYIDPPYNTGSAFEHYDDNLEHATWLNMMYPRLKLLREFLREDGSIWISIDDREGAYLRVICDEIFGRQNFVSNISWQRTYSKRNDSKGIPAEAEHILVYSKRKGWTPKRLTRTQEMDAKYTSPDGDANAWSSVTINAPGAKTHAGMVYAIQHPITGEFLYPPTGRCWSFGQPQLLEYMNEWAEYELKPLDDYAKRREICGDDANVPETINALVLKDVAKAKAAAEERFRLGQEKKRPWPLLYFTGKGKGGIRRKQYLAASAGRVATNLWLFEEVGHTEEAKREIFALFGASDAFATPKPERLIRRIIEISTDAGDLVLDSFLGSGTTAAVSHKMGRRWIGIEMGDHARTHCAVRMRKVVDGEPGGISKAVKWQGGGGFRFYELGEPILKPDGTLTADIPFEVMAAHVWWRETGTPWEGLVSRKERKERRERNERLCDLCVLCGKGKSPVLGVHGGVAYALLYNGILHDRRVNGGNVLTRKTLALIREDLGEAECDRLIVYGEATRLLRETLAAEKIEFRQTPYDLVFGR